MPRKNTAKPRADAGRPILKGLNPAQREAVLHGEGPLLVLAGAGSGKTRVITHRIAHLLHGGCPADGVLAITFTNKAAEEMKVRTEQLCGVASPWVSTFHSFCARILRRHIHRLEPYDNAFSIYDAEDSRSVIKSVLKESRVEKDIWTPRAAQAEISRRKNACSYASSEEFAVAQYRERILEETFNAYVARMQERNALDFDDLLLLTVRLFRECPDVLERYTNQFRHVLIDEYQDINAAQYEIGKLLTIAHRNICITGDPDQSIYRWRGADITNILNFEKDYPDARRITLDRNYRSSANILHVANALIAHNKERLPKSLWTEAGRGEPVRLYCFDDEVQEASEIASLVRATADGGISLGDIAVFCRINALSRPVEQEMIYANIPYSVVGGIEFFLRKEVKDILGYLRILANPRDTESVARIINVPLRGIGKKSWQRLLEQARSKGRPLLEVLVDEPEDLPVGGRAAAGLAAFVELYRSLAAGKDGPVGETVRAVIEQSGYEEYLEKDTPELRRERVANIWELQNAAAQYDGTHADGSLAGFLETVNLLGDVDRWNRSEDRVAIMSLHSAKGLEFRVVIILGVEDGIVPLVRSDEPEGDIEEERRLLYVGITRARERLYLTHAATRTRFGMTRNAFPSRFLRELRTGDGTDSLEMDRETLEGLEPPDGLEGDDAWPVEQEFAGGDEDPYPVGARVYHDEYGEGEVTRISGIGARRRITVAFDEGGDKQFVSGFAPLRRARRRR